MTVLAKRKRRESFGAVRKLPSGRIQASYVGPDGVRHAAPNTFDNMTDARGWLATQQVAINSGEWNAMVVAGAEKSKARRAEVFGDYAQDWIVNRVNRHGDFLRPRTKAEYERLIAGPLLPLADYRLNSLSPEVIRKWNSEQLSTGKKTQTGRAYGLLKSILQTAVEDQRIPMNPCIIRGAQNASTGKEVTPPTREELDIILGALSPKYRVMVLVTAWGALRFGEVTELRRSDVDFVFDDNGKVDLILLNIRRSVSHLAGQGFIVGQPKTRAGVRSVILPPVVNAEFLQYLDTVGESDDSLLFPAANGGHMNQSSLAKAWYPARAKAGRSDLPFHGLRHFGGTVFAQTGATLQEIQDRLGHTSVVAAMRYQHSAGRENDLVRLMK